MFQIIMKNMTKFGIITMLGFTNYTEEKVSDGGF